MKKWWFAAAVLAFYRALLALMRPILPSAATPEPLAYLCLKQISRLQNPLQELTSPWPKPWPRPWPEP
jgi:hypothetical protein